MAYFISSFSEKCGVNKESIRYYERKNGSLSNDVGKEKS